jgi:branched-chain amino acid transport system ATP-binding protein
LAVLLSEQNLHFAAEVADRAAIIEKGRICYLGEMAALRTDEAAQRAYLSA